MLNQLNRMRVWRDLPDRQTDRQTDKTDRKTDRQTNRQTDRQMPWARPACPKIIRQVLAPKVTDRQAGRQTGRQGQTGQSKNRTGSRQMDGCRTWELLYRNVGGMPAVLVQPGKYGFGRMRMPESNMRTTHIK